MAERDVLVVLLERVIASVEAMQLTMMGIMGKLLVQQRILHLRPELVIWS